MARTATPVCPLRTAGAASSEAIEAHTVGWPWAAARIGAVASAGTPDGPRRILLAEAQVRELGQSGCRLPPKRIHGMVQAERPGSTGR